MDFWNRVRQELARVGRTQQWLAQAIGEDANKLRRWFSKGTMPNADQAVAIAKALELSVEALVHGDGEPLAADPFVVQEREAGYLPASPLSAWLVERAGLVSGLARLPAEEVDEVELLVLAKLAKLDRQAYGGGADAEEIDFEGDLRKRAQALGIQGARFSSGDRQAPSATRR